MNSIKAKKLIEQYKNLKAQLSEKKYDETSFADIIKPGLEFLKQIDDAQKNGELDLPPVDENDIKISDVLKTSEKDLSVDGTLNEAYFQNKQGLQEAGKSYQQIVKEYLDQGGSGDYNEWREWAKTIPEAEKALAVNSYNFRKLYELAGGTVPASTSTKRASAEEPFTPPTPKADYQMSAELKNLIDVAEAGQDFVETAATTVADKYETIELLLRRVIRGKAAKRYYILAGDAGIGKTYTVSKILQEEGKADIDSITYTGSIGRSISSIALFLWQHKDDEIIVLDDCDTFLRKGGNPDVVNILKGCMEPGTNYKVGIPSSIANKITKELARGKKDESKVSDKVKRLFESEDEEEEEQDEEILDDEELDISDVIPTAWQFNARLVIISNLHESQIEDALWSRCDHFDLHLTQEEYLVRLGMIINGMDVGQKAGLCTPEEAAEAKALVVSVMTSIIEAGNNGVKLYGKYIKLTDHLEFRIVKDLVNVWLAMLDRYVEQHPGVDRDEAKKAIMPRWIRIGVIPRMSAAKTL